MYIIYIYMCVCVTLCVILCVCVPVFCCMHTNKSIPICTGWISSVAHVTPNGLLNTSTEVIKKRTIWTFKRIGHHKLVVGIPTPLKNMSQLG